MDDDELGAFTDWQTRNGQKRQPGASLDWLAEFKLTGRELEEISAPSWVYEGLLPQGHVIAIVAKPNGGKTTICFDIACQLASRFKVVYVHSDTGPSDAKQMFLKAEAHGFDYLTPDLKVGLTMRDVMFRLEELANSDADLNGHVWFFDTLKKMANMIQKRSLKAVLELMRKLSSRGMTVVLLGHTNKYKDASGNYIYEGTADLESDCDELIYLDPQAEPDGTLVVSSVCDLERGKRRAEIEPITWRISPDRSVKRMRNYVDVAAKQREETLRENDQDAIEIIIARLNRGPAIQSRIVELCAEHKINRKRVLSVLKRWDGKLWVFTTPPGMNAKQYEIYAPLGQGTKGTTEHEKSQI